MSVADLYPIDLPARVCVVDDDATSLAATVKALRGDFELLVARSGAEALRLIARERPDVAVLDVDMPDLDGLAVCRKLKADDATRELPVVFLTSHGDEDTELRGLEAGAADFICKPPRGPAVVARLRNLVRLRRLTEQLRRASLTDGLTGLANRASLDQTLAQELTRAQRHGHPLALLMIDVDHFKAYNDLLGHVAGDEALRRVGRVLGGAARRAGDLASRCGGEEFVLLLPATDLAGASHAAQALVEAMRQLALPHPGSTTAAHLTVSIGVGMALHGSADTDAARLLARADAALYAAKRHGRNQVWTVTAEGAAAMPLTPASTGELIG